MTTPEHCPCQCGTAPTTTMTFGCVHEHIGDRQVCAAGEALGRRLASNGLLWCDHCRDAGHPETPMTLLAVRPLAGASR